MQFRDEIERSIIGALLINPGSYGRVSEFLTRHAFRATLHQEVWVACGMLRKEDTEILLKTVRRTILTARQSHTPGFVDDQAQNLALELSQITVTTTGTDVLYIERLAMQLIEHTIRDRFLQICQTVTSKDGAFYHVVCEWTQDISDYSMRSLEVLEEAAEEWKRISPSHAGTLGVISLHEEITLLARRIKVALENRKPADPMPKSQYRSMDGAYERDTPVLKKEVHGKTSELREAARSRKKKINKPKDFTITRPLENELSEEIANSMVNGF